MTLYTSPIDIGWVINQEDENGIRYAIRFGAKFLSERQRMYAQVRRELWRIVTIAELDQDYFMWAEVVIETDCLPILRMIYGMFNTKYSYVVVDNILA